MHFDPKKYTKNYKMRLIQNKEDMISYYQLKKMGKKRREGSKIRSKLSKMRKIQKYNHLEDSWEEISSMITTRTQFTASIY